MKHNPTLFAVLRWAAAALALALIISLCAGSDTSSADQAQVAEAVLAELDLTQMQQADNQMVKRLYGLSPSDYEGLTLWYPITNMEAQEVLVIKLADPAQADAIRAAVEKRLETQKKSFDGYGIEQYDLLTNHSILEVQGNFVLFVVNENAEKALAAFLAAL